MSAPYLDTGFALKRYVQEPNSALVRAALATLQLPLLLTDILEMELVNALQAKVFRREMSHSERDQCLAAFHADIAAGFWKRQALEPAQLRKRVLALAAKHTSTLGTRTLDLVHIAAALELGCTEFLSLDNRQRAAALAEGLATVP